MKKRLLAVLLIASMLMCVMPVEAFAMGPVTVLCPHHTEHTDECGYVPPADGQPCSHEHTEKCLAEKTVCLHVHDESCRAEAAENQQEIELNCNHICTEENGCVTQALDCAHERGEHDAECGYAEENPGQPCGYICKICLVQALIEELPDDVTAENGEDVSVQLDTIDEAKAALSDEELDALDISKYERAVSALNNMAGQPDASVPVPADEQFTGLTLGKTYWFDLSQENIPGAVHDLSWMPFVYAGTVNAYVLPSKSVADTELTDESVKQYQYDHSLFVGKSNCAEDVSFDTLNENSLIYGKSYTSGGVDYTLRAPTGGKHFKDGAINRTPASNEWDTILSKNSNYIPYENQKTYDNWTQDVANSSHNSCVTRGGWSTGTKYWSTAYSNELMKFRPFLEVLNPGSLGSDGLREVAINLNGGAIGTETGTLYVVAKTGSAFTAPSNAAIAYTGYVFTGWQGSDGTVYKPGATVPYGVTSLTACWSAENTTEQFAGLEPGETYWFDVSSAGIPGTQNSDLPSTLKWVPFTYTGTINAYSRTSAGVSTYQNEAYLHSLFISNYAVTNRVSWNDLNSKRFIFGKNYISGGVSYTMRAPSMGSSKNADIDAAYGSPTNNEWDAIP